MSLTGVSPESTTQEGGATSILEQQFKRNIMYRPHPVDRLNINVGERPVYGIPYLRAGHVPFASRSVLSRDMVLNRGIQNSNARLGQSLPFLKARMYDMKGGTLLGIQAPVQEASGLAGVEIPVQEASGQEGGEDEPNPDHVDEVVSILTGSGQYGGSPSFFTKLGKNVKKAAKTVAHGIKKAAVSTGKFIKKEHLISKGLNLASGLVEKYGGPAAEAIGAVIASEGGPVGAIIGAKLGKEGAKLAGKAVKAAANFAEKKGFGDLMPKGLHIDSTIGQTFKTGRHHAYQAPIDTMTMSTGDFSNRATNQGVDRQSFVATHPLNFRRTSLAELS